MSASTRFTRSRRAAQCSAVEPSASVAFTNARCFESVWTAAVLPDLTASISRTSPVAALETRLAPRRRAAAEQILNLDCTLAHPKPILLDTALLRHGQEQIRHRRVLGCDDVTVAFHAAGST